MPLAHLVHSAVHKQAATTNTWRSMILEITHHLMLAVLVGEQHKELNATNKSTKRIAILLWLCYQKKLLVCHIKTQGG